MKRKPLLFVIAGPTAAGKSAFAVRLAKKLKGEIVSFDAMQVYQGVPVLTNQPSQKERKGIRHHLIGFLSLTKEFSAPQFSKEAKKVIEGVVQRKRVPILVGGSGFYLKALLEGAHAPVKAVPALRRKYLKLVEEKGGTYLYQKLRAIDPERARRIHPNDIYRLVRALEIYEATGRRPSEFEKGKGGLADIFRVQKIGLRLSRSALYERIDRRVGRMIKNGALKEAKRLFKKRLSLTARRIIGLEELFSHLKGEISLEAAIAGIQQNTRHYAKRQETWFRRQKGIRWLSPILFRR